MENYNENHTDNTFENELQENVLSMENEINQLLELKSDINTLFDRKIKERQDKLKCIKNEKQKHN